MNPETKARQSVILKLIERNIELESLLSEKVERLDYWMKRCRAAELERDEAESKLAELDGRESAAVKTLGYMGYTHNVGELWRPPIGRQYALLGDTILNAPSHKALDFGMFKINVTNQKVEVDFNKPLTMIKEEGFQCVVRPHESIVPNTDWAKVRPTLGVNDLKGSTTVGTIAFAGHLKENMVSIGDEHPWKFTSTEDCSNDLVNPPIIKELYQNSWLRPLGSKDETTNMDFVKSNSNPEIVELNDAKPSQPIANNSEPAQRITEQDARAIITDLANELESEVMAKYTLDHLKYPSQKAKFDADMSTVHAARTLLAKLNEHREQEAKPNESVGEVKKVIINAFGFYAEVKCNIEIKPGDKLYLHPQVTPNKEEVPNWKPIESAPKDKLIDIWIENKGGKGVRWSDCYYDQICDDWRTSGASGHLVFVPARCVTHWMNSPLPPLKDE